MASRKFPLSQGEYFHIYNRGIDGRKIIQDRDDLDRFLIGMRDFNQIDTIGSLYEFGFRKKNLGNQVSKVRSAHDGKPLVAIVAYNILPNHFHIILKPLVEGGGSAYLKRALGGYTKYFNEKYGRTGQLLQSPFKSTYIRTGHHLHHMQAYVNLNDYIHAHGVFPEWLGASSWQTYRTSDTRDEICNADEIEMILSEFNNRGSYIKSSLETADLTWCDRKEDQLGELCSKDVDDQKALSEELGNQVSKWTGRS